MSSILMGLDVGFGETKLVSSAKPGSPIVYPSFVHPTKEGSSKLFNLKSIDPSYLNVKTETGHYLVGDYAKNVPSSVSKRTKARNRAKDEFSQVLFQTAIALGCPDEEGEYTVRIVTGLPNTDYELGMRDELEEFLGKTFEVEFMLSMEKSVKKKIFVEDVEVLRQPEGSMSYSQFLFSPEEGELLTVKGDAHEYIGLIDIGHYTTDFGLFNQGVIIQDGEVSGSTIAVDDLYRQFKNETVKYFSDINIQYSPTDADMDQLIRTKDLFFAGVNHDMTSVFEEAVSQTANRIVKEVLESWRTEINRVGRVYLTGGGSHALSEEIAKVFEENGVQAFTQIENPTVANAIGFYMFGVIKMVSEGKLSLDQIKETYAYNILDGDLLDE